MFQRLGLALIPGSFQHITLTCIIELLLYQAFEQIIIYYGDKSCKLVLISKMKKTMIKTPYMLPISFPFSVCFDGVLGTKDRAACHLLIYAFRVHAAQY